MLAAWLTTYGSRVGKSQLFLVLQPWRCAMPERDPRLSECSVCPATLGSRGMPLKRCVHLEGVGYVRLFAFDDEWAVLTNRTAKGGFTLMEPIVAKAEAAFGRAEAELLRLGEPARA